MSVDDWPEDQRDKFNQQTELSYNKIGRFVVKYEHMLSAMRFTIQHGLSGHGISRGSNVLYVMLGAIPELKLVAVLEACYYPLFLNNSESIESLNHVVRDVRSIIEFRNRLVHTQWFIGWTSQKETDWSDFHGDKLKYLKEGRGGLIGDKMSIQRIDDHIDLAITLYKIFFYFLVAISR